MPVEPRAIISQIEPAPLGLSWVTRPYAALLCRAARRAGLRTPGAVFGLAWSGAMTAPRVAGLLQRLPEGLSEIYTHPGTAGGFPGQAPGYRYVDELAALTGSEVITAARRHDLTLGGYSDF